MAAPKIIDPDENGIYHPKTEGEIQALVKYAYDNHYQVRVRGSGHSVSAAIYSNDAITKVNMLLDRYTGVQRDGPDSVFVTAQAGVHLGHDPNDPLSTEENSLLYQLHYKYQLAVEELGGITRQTVSGFLSTGSSGGSVKYGFLDNVYALRIIDGTGQIFEVRRNDDGRPGSVEFQAALVCVGLLGVLSTVTFKCISAFNIKGSQESELVDSSKQIDMYNDKPEEPKKGLATFFKETPYARIMWWPQTASILDIELKERIQVWHADRYGSDIEPGKRFKDFGSPMEMMLASYFLTLMGNIGSDDLGSVMNIMDNMQSRFVELQAKEIENNCESIDPKKAEYLAKTISRVLMIVFKQITNMTHLCTSKEERLRMLPAFSTALIAATNILDGTTKFEDTSFQGLPMDNTDDDVIFPCSFNEMWVPMSYATKSTNLLHEYFKGGFSKTGSMAWELYASKPSDAWMSMSYTNGNDEWKDGAFRIDSIWFDHNSADPQEFYTPVWKLFSDNGIPFRLHWGKYFPKIESGAKATDSPGKVYDWQKIIVMDRYPCLKEFLQIRKKRDPRNIFLSDYWRHWYCVDREDELI